MNDTRLTFAEQAEQLLGNRDHHTICHALQVAAERFDHDAASLEQAAIEIEAWEAANPGKVAPIMTARGAAMSADMFRRQAKDTRDVLARLRGDDEQD